VSKTVISPGFPDGELYSMGTWKVESAAVVADYEWLVGHDGARWLETAKSAALEQKSLANLATRLRQELPPERVHLVLEQLDLRQRAKEKFGAAERMFFTRVALEQATDQWVAAYKASRFPTGEPVADLCCGIGGDLLALAGRGPVWAIDRNRANIVLALANLQAALGDNATPKLEEMAFCHGDYRVRFDAIDVEKMTGVGGLTAWHIDPDRRPAGKRTTKLEWSDPGSDVLTRLIANCPNGAIKLAPAADLEETWWGDAELEWIGRGRQCRQLVAWFGSLAKQPGKRRATAIQSAATSPNNIGADSNAIATTTFSGEPDVEPEYAEQIGRYIFEPDAAVLAAKLEGALARQHGLMAITPGVAYFTADRPVGDALLDCFEVLEVMPYRTKVIRQWLTQRGIGRLEVKKRGVPLDPAEVRRELLGSHHSGEEVTLLLARVSGKVAAIFARRMARGDFESG
jgi:THUMP domain-containing protein